MTSITWETFLASAAGRTTLAWERGACARFLASKAGDRALQVGLADLNPFAASPITHRILVDDFVSPKADKDDFRDRVVALPAELPLEGESCDVVVLAHAFDRFPQDMDAVTREAARVLAPNGLLVTLFFNAIGGWALKGRLFSSRRILPDNAGAVTMASAKAAVAAAGLTLEGGNFGVYAVSPNPDGSPVRLPGWIDKAGDRWWPTLSNVIVLTARKLDESATLVGKVNFSVGKTAKPVPAALRNLKNSEETPRQ